MSCTSTDYVRHPGKFEASGELGEKLWEIIMHGLHDDYFGDSELGGWHGLITDSGYECAPHAIVMCDNNGFVTFVSYDSAEEARSTFEMWREEDIEAVEFE